MTVRTFTVANGRRILSEHELLGHLKPKELKKLLASARVQRFGAGEILFRKGDRGDKLFVVLSGRIMIGTRLGPGKVNVLDILGEGRIFGEVALLDGAERAADAVALVESRLMVLERGDFVSFLDDHREAAQRLMAALCGRVRSISEPESYQAVRFAKLPVRLAKKLLLLADPPNAEGCHEAHKDCPPGGDDETTPGGKHSALIFTLMDTATLTNDDRGDYVHNEDHVKALAGGQNQPNKPGVQLDLRGGGSTPRTLMVQAVCTDVFFGNCASLPAGFLNDQRPRVILSVRPYENSCPGDPPPVECPDIFTMVAGESEEMSFRILFHEGLIIEAASNIGGSSGPNPGRCLSLLDSGDRNDFIEACEPGGDTCNVTVTASDLGDSAGSGAGDGENDAWAIVGTGVRAIICDLSTNTVIGEMTIDVDLDAIKR